MSAVGRLPLTARSSSSHETPRTGGGGFTARSSGEKGTPRDAQRLALGERPRDEAPQARPEGWHGAVPPIVSPHHTARSAELSLDLNSMTPSSQGDSLSSRSRFNAYPSGECFGAAEELALRNAAAHVAMPWHAHTEASPAPPTQHQGVSTFDVQKSLEITRVVIVKENQTLKELVQRSQDCLNALRGEAESMAESRGAMREPMQLEWLVRNIDEAIAGGPWGLQEQEEFRAPEFPGAIFRFELRGREGPSPGSEPCLELSLEVSGRAALGLELAVGLLLETEEEASSRRAVQPQRATLRHGEPATLIRPWPRGACVAFCRTEVERLWPTEHMVFRGSSWALLQSSTWGQWD